MLASSSLATPDPVEIHWTKGARAFGLGAPRFVFAACSGGQSSALFQATGLLSGNWMRESRLGLIKSSLTALLITICSP